MIITRCFLPRQDAPRRPIRKSHKPDNVQLQYLNGYDAIREKRDEHNTLTADR